MLQKKVGYAKMKKEIYLRNSFFGGEKTPKIHRRQKGWTDNVDEIICDYSVL